MNSVRSSIFMFHGVVLPNKEEFRQQFNGDISYGLSMLYGVVQHCTISPVNNLLRKRFKKIIITVEFYLF